jgi:Rieske Fe-S protein
MATGQASVRTPVGMDEQRGGKFTRRNLLLGAMGLSATAFVASFSVVPFFVTKVLQIAVQEIAVGDQLVYSAVSSGAAAGDPVKASDIQPGKSVQAFPKGKADNQQNLVEIVRVAAGSGKEGLVAYSAICTHLACVVQSQLNQANQIACPCHNSHFDPKNEAAVVGGPAPRPLPSLPIEVGADGIITAAGPFSAPVGVV